MEEFTTRIGIPSFIQMVIECWNELFLTIIVVVLFISRRHNEIGKTYNVKIPLTNEILIFYVAIFLYTLFDIFCTASYGDTSAKGLEIYVASAFGYYATGMFQTVFFFASRQAAHRRAKQYTVAEKPHFSGTVPAYSVFDTAHFHAFHKGVVLV